jgi:hypothetical protein
MLSLLSGLFTTYKLATADVATDRTEVSSGLIAMWSILILTTLCTAGIVCIVGFGNSSTCSVPGMQVMLVLVIALSDRLTCFTTPGSSFTLPDSEFFLDGLVAAYRLVTSAVKLYRDAITFVFLMNLCDAGIALGFSNSSHRLFTGSVPGMQVILVISALGVGLTEVLHLDLGFLLGSQITSLAPGSIFTLTDCEFFLITIITGLLFLGGMLTRLYLVQ